METEKHAVEPSGPSPRLGLAFGLSALWGALIMGFVMMRPEGVSTTWIGGGLLFLLVTSFLIGDAMNARLLHRQKALQEGLRRAARGDFEQRLGADGGAFDGLVDRLAADREERESSDRGVLNLLHAVGEPWIWFENERVKECNQAALRLFSEGSVDSLLEQSWLDLSPPLQKGGLDSRESLVVSLNKVNGGGWADFAWTFRGPDGEPFQTEVHAGRLSLWGEQGVLALVGGSSRSGRAHGAGSDQALEGRGAVLAALSHQVRTPLNGIVGLAEQLRNDAALAEASRERAILIHQAGGLLLGVVDNLLDFQKIEAGDLQLREEDFDLHRVVHETVDMFQESAREKGLELTRRIVPGAPRLVYGDAYRLRQVLVNLLSNAVRYTETGKVSVTLEAEPGDSRQVTLEVMDSGPGLEPARLAALLDGQDRSQGLGLSISGKLVTMMGGSLRGKSEPGKGSLFSVVIKLGEARGAPTRTREEPEGPVTGIPGDARILVVEDEPISQEVIRGILERYDLEVTVVGDGEEALRRLESEAFDLIFLDCQMPLMDGFETCRRLRRLEAGRRQEGVTPVVAVTAHAMKGDREKCMAAGMDDYLTKPVRGRELTAALLRWLSPEGSRTADLPGGAAMRPVEVALDRELLDEMRVTLEERFVPVLEDLGGLLRQRLVEVQESLDRGNNDQLGRSAHGLKGLGLQFGLNRVASVARDLEHLAENGDLSTVRLLITRLEDEVLEAAERLQDELAAAGK